jgi:hypothetical protein
LLLAVVVVVLEAVVAVLVVLEPAQVFLLQPERPTR